MVARRDERITRLALGSANPGGRLKGGDDAPQLVEAIPVDQIDPDPDQPRRHFDDTKLRELADTLLANGQIQPITVVRVGDRYTILVGERRWRACRLAGLPIIRAIVRATPLDAQRALVAQLVENEQRADLAVSELIEAVQKLAKLGLKNVEIAKALGRNPTRISELQALAEAPDALATIVDTIGLGLSYQLLRQWRAYPAPTLEFLAHVPVEHIGRITIATIGQTDSDAETLPAGGLGVAPARAARASSGDPETSSRAGKGGQTPPSSPRLHVREPAASGAGAGHALTGSIEVDHPLHGAGRVVFDHPVEADHLAVSFNGARPIVLHKQAICIARILPTPIRAS